MEAGRGNTNNIRAIEHYLNRKSVLFIIVLSIFSCPTVGFSQTDADARELIYGKWKECTKISYDTIISIDSSYTCNEKWLYDFKENGKYLQNLFVECDGKQYQEEGTWKLEKGELTMHAAFYCTNGQAYPETLKIIWLNKDKWVFIGKESEKVLVYIFYERVYER